MKRDRESSAVEAPENTKRRSDGEVDPIRDAIAELDTVQQQLQSLEEECAREQISIQRKFDAQKRPLFDQRAEIVKQIPLFWSNALQSHPALRNLQQQDVEILQFLETVSLEDNLDEQGSYKICLGFSNGVNEYMEQTVLMKHVEFVNGDERIKECTQIAWKPNKNPIEAAKKKNEEKDGADNDESPVFSIFEWFTDNPCDEAADLGEIIRRDVWHMPVPYYLGAADDIDEDITSEDDAN